MNLIFPKKCPYCGEIIKGNELECEKCRAGFPDKPYIRILPSGNECVAAFKYHGVIRDAMQMYKFRGKREFYKSFSAVLAEAVDKCGWNFDLITSVPLSKKRMRTRGYNQAELIAREVGRLFSVEYRRTLEKFRENKEQHSLNHDQRETNIIDVYRCLDGIALSGKTIFVVDDIVTTGYTLSECCRVLEENNNTKIICGAIASVV